MANSVFARKQLLKHGWTEGAGLGKDESGIKEAIKVKIKNDTTGVGHDPGKEFTYHWWDHVFNKAASSITVETTEGGVLLKKSSEEVTQRAKTVTRSALYAGFVKGAVLQATDEEVMTEVSCHNDSESESDEEKEKKAISKLTEEELFSQCEGRTAHKGARHGLKQNAKLLRIQQQEQLLLEKIRANQKTDNSSSVDDRQELRANSHSGHSQEGLGLHEMEIPSATCSDEMPGKKKKKKSKQKPRDLDSDTTENDVVVVDILSEVTSEEAKAGSAVNRKHKKSKKKKRKAETVDENDRIGNDKKDRKTRS